MATKKDEKKPVKKTKKTVENKEAKPKKVVKKKTAESKKIEKPVEKKSEVEIKKKKPVKKVSPAKEIKETSKTPKLETKEKTHEVLHKPNFSKKQQGETKNRKKYKKERRIQAKVQAGIEEQIRQENANVIKVTETLTVNMLAENLKVSGAEIITKLMKMGVLATLNQRIDNEVAELIADEYGYVLKYISIDDIKLEETDDYKDEDYKQRPPIITIMGHVDHGKTSLLDVIRKSDVVSGEAGGITQHIGAYQVETKYGVLSFLDTPGHEAFTAMRARGAQVTDIAIIVVAADDGLMPQTFEAIDHAKAGGVPIIVAVNKMDLPTANPDKVLQQLSTHGLTPEEWGGKTICVKVSARTKDGIDELLEMIALQAEMMELKAPNVGHAKGFIIEAELDKKRGAVATILVQKGVLKKGDAFVAGTAFGKVRMMMDDRGNQKKEAYPATPVEILGFNGVPEAGDSFVVVESEKEAKRIADQRRKAIREERLSRKKHTTLEDLNFMMQQGEAKEFNVILKADVRGSVEALKDSLERMSTNEVKLNVIHDGSGAVNESDVMLAVASDAIIISFNLPVSNMVYSIAEKEAVEIREYKIIYQVIEEIKLAMEGLLAPTIEQELIGKAEVRQVITIPKIGAIAGSMVLEGKIVRDALVKIYREDKLILESKISQLKRFKDNVKEVEKGFECGISVENFNDFKAGDIIEVFKEKQILRKL